MKLLTKFVDFILYTNIWIGLGAFLLYQQSLYFFGAAFAPTPLAFLVGCSTVWLYSLHRAVGIRKIKSIQSGSRFYKIHRLRIPIYLIGILSLLASFYFLLQIDFRFVVALSFPGLVSILYVLPVFSKNRRLRDLGIVKIFLVALTWSWLTVLIPWHETGEVFGWSVVLALVDRFCFIFAITLPFDIRDLKIDALTSVKTIPSILGVKASQRLSYFLLLISSLFLFFQYLSGLLSLGYLFACLCFYFICQAIIYFIQNKEEDYYYTGLLDGTMILMPVFVYVFCFVFA